MARVFISSVIPAEPAKVWDRVRDFNAMPKWHPSIRASRIEDALPPDKIGCIRHFHLQNGDALREQLVGLSDYDLFFTYTMLDGPMPLWDYMATMRLTPITDGNRTFAEWTAEFECKPEDEGDLLDTVGNHVFQGGFNALKRHFGG